LFLIADSTLDHSARRAARSVALTSPDDVMRRAAASSMSSWADSTDIPALLDAVALGMRDTSPNAVEAAIEVLAGIESRGHHAADAFFTRFPAAPSEIIYGLTGRAFGPRTLAAWGSGRPIQSTRTDADYRRIVETLVVPAYRGAALPRLRWETTRGTVETELNALDAPLATDYLLDLVARGAMRNVQFTRVIPNFVAQQQVVLLDEPLQRDEISRGRLVRGNLSWGTNIGNARRFGTARGPGAAYDMGPANYTFGVAPQPHNEGDFTALGLIVRGMDIVDHIELGDVVKSVRRVPR
jgi:cyclophilin family peptidyl-prolyl cis-trans isomerase